jgi:hypothetical protein
LALVVIHGLSPQVPEEILSGADQVVAWSVDRVNEMWFPCMKVAYTAPVLEVASVMSYCPFPQLAQSGLTAPHVDPPSVDVRVLMVMLGPEYCIQAV